MYEGSGHVYADLGLEDADELLTRSEIGTSGIQDSRRQKA